MWYLYIIAIVLVDTCYVSIAKYWSLHTEKWYLPLLAFCFLIFTNIFFLYALVNGSGLARGVMYFGVLSALFGVVVGSFFFKEHITYLNSLGIILGLISLLLLR